MFFLVHVNFVESKDKHKIIRRLLTISKPRKRKQLVRAQVYQIILLETLRHDTGIHFNREHYQVYRAEYFIDLANLSLILEVYPRVEVGNLGFGMSEFAYKLRLAFVKHLAALYQRSVDERHSGDQDKER